MKKNLLLYLSIFLALYIVFQYVNSKNYFENSDAKILKLETKIMEQDSLIDQWRTQWEDASSFTLEESSLAREYHENRDRDVSDILTAVEDAVISSNDFEGDEHPLVPYAPINGKYLINRIKVINHRWVLAEFSNGTDWGEVLLKYFVVDDGKIELELGEHVLYVQ